VPKTIYGKFKERLAAAKSSSEREDVYTEVCFAFDDRDLTGREYLKLKALFEALRKEN
jgi:hypothetical protein